jgi:NADPH:quinone reductase-like Zn-dependent oxidoreductase
MKSTAIIQQGKSIVLGEAELPPLKEHQVYVKVEYAAFNPTDRMPSHSHDPCLKLTVKDLRSMSMLLEMEQF